MKGREFYTILVHSWLALHETFVAIFILGMNLGKYFTISYCFYCLGMIGLNAVMGWDSFRKNYGFSMMHMVYDMVISLTIAHYDRT